MKAPTRNTIQSASRINHGVGRSNHGGAASQGGNLASDLNGAYCAWAKRGTPATDKYDGPTTTTGGGLGVHNWSATKGKVKDEHAHAEGHVSHSSCNDQTGEEVKEGHARSLEPVGLVRVEVNAAHLNQELDDDAQGNQEDGDCVHGSLLGHLRVVESSDARLGNPICLRHDAEADKSRDRRQQEPRQALPHQKADKVSASHADERRAALLLNGGAKHFEWGHASDAHSSIHLRRLGGALGLGKLGPDPSPRLLAQVLAPQDPIGFKLKTPCLCGTHIAPASKALVQVLLVDAVFGGELASNFRGKNLAIHARTLARSYSLVKRLATHRLPSDLLQPAHMKAMETSPERRKRKLNELIQLEGGLDPAKGDQPGHYRIAETVCKFEGTNADFRQMAQTLRQYATGWKGKAPGNAVVNRIEAAYEAAKLHGLTRGWFDADDQAQPSGLDDLAPDEVKLIAVIRGGLTTQELIQLTEAVKAAVKTKNTRVSRGEEIGELGVYFAVDRRNHDERVESERRELAPWEKKKSPSAGGRAEGSSK